MIRSRGLAGLAVSAAMIIGGAAPAAAAQGNAPVRLSLPAPTGRHPVGTVSLHLVDPTRTDPWVPTHPVRELMAQVWYPARDVAGHPLAPWMAAGALAHFTAAAGIPPGAAQWPLTHAHEGAPVDRHPGGGRPVVLFSPGSGGDRTDCTVLAEELASRGFVVIALDHPHDSGEVQFPDGRVEVRQMPPEQTPGVNLAAVAVRVADVEFVLNRLAAINTGADPDAEHRPLPVGLAGAFDLHRVGIFGHSLGGATAVAAMHDDPRIRAGVNLDGSMMGPVLDDGLARPVLLFASGHHGRDNDPSWALLWSHLRGPRLDLRLQGAGHLSFTDFEVLVPVLAPAIGIPPPVVVQQIGTIEPRRAVTIERTYLTAFFDRWLRHRDGRLLDGPSARFPEIGFDR